MIKEIMIKEMKDLEIQNTNVCDIIIIENIKAQIQVTQDELMITDLENAEARGKEATIYIFTTNKFIFNKMNLEEIETFENLIEKLKDENIKYFHYNTAGKEVFNPFQKLTDKKVIEKIKAKEKVTKNDVIKLIRTKNSKIKCRERLSDDYRFDNAENFFKDTIIEVNSILKKIIENNHFTFFKESTKEYTLFSSFETYELTIN